MTASVPDILARIVARKREELAAASVPLSELERRASRAVRRDFTGALAAALPAIIAEAKKASPSKGVLAPDYDAARIARTYESGGASALSVLTDESFFQGSLADLEAARTAVALPVLRKDFTIDPRHVFEAAAAGADCILLIAAILTETQIREFQALAASYGMASLVEVHDAAELDIALAAGAKIVGVNNRDLHTFEVSLATAEALAKSMPEGIVRVAESGIHSAGDVRRLQDSGYQAFLVGEHLMKAGDPAAALRALRS